MKYNVIPVIISVLLLLTGCGNKTKAINTENTATEILNKINFEDKLEAINDDIAINIYGFNKDNVKEIATYLGSGATAEEVTVVEFNEITEADKQLFTKRIDDQITAYESYIPKEIARIKENVIIQSGNTVILCVSDSSKNAKSVIDNLIN